MNPVRLSVRSKYINFNDKTEIDMSTIKRVETINVPLIVSYGSLESDEFKRQSDEFVKKLKDSQKEVKFIMQPYFNHFEIVEDYGNQYIPLTALLHKPLKADFTKSYQIQGTTWVLGLPNSVNLFNTATRA